jgi:hypothetical protein
MIVFLIIWCLCGLVSFVSDLQLTYSVYDKIIIKDFLHLPLFLLFGGVILFLIIIVELIDFLEEHKFAEKISKFVNYSVIKKK